MHKNPLSYCGNELSPSPNFDWQSIRNSFELDPEYIHLSLGMLAPHPSVVREKIALHRQGLDRNPTLYYRNKEVSETRILGKIAQYLECSSSGSKQIALTESTTMGLSIVYSGICLEEGGEILTTTHEHYAAWEILRFKALREKIELKRISLYENGQEIQEEKICEKIVAAITAKTRLIALTWVHSCTGVKLPIQRICKKISILNHTRSPEEQILVAIDGLHALGIEDFRVEDLGVDFFIAGCHKSLFGPRGTGFVWGSQKGWDRVLPMTTSFLSPVFWSWYKQKNPDTECPKAWLCTPGGFQAYEHRWALDAAFDFHLSIGKKRIAERISSLNHYCKEKMKNLPKIKVHTPDSPLLSSGMICFEIEGFDPSWVVERLIEKKIVTGQTPYHRSYNRFMTGLLNNFEEIDRALHALIEI